MKAKDWISVTDALPIRFEECDYSELVLTLCEYKEDGLDVWDVLALRYNYYLNEWCVPNYYYDEDVTEWRVTHWMPIVLPE